MAFTAKIKDSKVVKGIFEAVSSIITETFLDIDPDKGIIDSTLIIGNDIPEKWKRKK